MPYAVLFANIGSDDFQPVAGHTYETGAQAAERMKWLQVSYGHINRYKVRQVAPEGTDPDAWRERERSNFYNERYVRVPWHNCHWNDALRSEHYAHLSLDEPGKIAFTASPEHGRADRQTRMAPGRYLTRYFKDILSPDEIERWAAEVSVCAGDCALQFTSCPDKIEEVYTNGPRSCMAHDADEYRGHCHPVRAYGHSPDLQLAFIGTEERWTGRCIVWPDKKLYSTPYGDCSRMRLLLDNAGYEHGSLSGARLKPLHDDNGNGYIMPYVDGIDYAAEEDGWLVLGHGRIECQSTEGVTEDDDRSTCVRCEERVDDEDLNYIADVEEHWCDDCTSKYTTRCEHDGERYRDSRHSFHEVYGLGYANSLTSETVVDDNLEDYGACYHDASGEYLTNQLFELVTALEGISGALSELPDPNQLGLAFETIALEQLAA
jgi:hypothetical protein